MSHNHAPQLAAEATQVDLSTWLSQAEVCRILGCAPRTLNENIQKHRNGIPGGWAIQREERPGQVSEGERGRQMEPCYHPGDVERVRAAKGPKAFAMPRETALVERKHGGGSGGGELLPLIERFADKTLAIVERLTARPDRGPWLRVKDAAAESGLSRATVRLIARQMLDAGSPDAIADGGLKIRRAALLELDGLQIGLYKEGAHAAKKAKAATRPAADPAERAAEEVIPGGLQ